MKTSISSQEQNFTDSFDAEKKKTPAEEVKEHPIPMQIETVNEHGKVGQKVDLKHPDNSPSAILHNVVKHIDEKLKENPDELRVVDEKGTARQPLENNINNSNLKDQTPAEKEREQKLTEDDVNPSKEERKSMESNDKVGRPIGNKIPNKNPTKPQSN